MPLQRVITDFGSDVAFGRIPEKLKEHYGITVPVSSSRLITHRHAEQALKGEETKTDIPQEPGEAVLIAEMDGTMIPIVTTQGRKVDLRTTRRVEWKEARLCLTRPKGSLSPIFGAEIGAPEEAGARLVNCAIRSGMGANTRVHGVGDGAPWIADQMSMIFGLQAHYLIDFYHLCDYLSMASEACAPQDKKGWMDEQKSRMRDNRSEEVLRSLEAHLEPEAIANKDAPVRACYRYISNRPGQFDYKGALAEGLPIGSGEIEGAHRYVIQSRLKISGAWWKMENARSMLALRVLRANSDWQAYWDGLIQKAA